MVVRSYFGNDGENNSNLKDYANWNFERVEKIKTEIARLLRYWYMLLNLQFDIRLHKG